MRAPDSGADPGFDQGGPQIVTGLKLPFLGLSFGAGASFLVVRGGPGPPGPPPGSAPETLGWMIGKLEDKYKGQWPRHFSKLTHAYNSTRSTVTGYLLHFLMFGQWPRLPIDLVFPTHEVMGTLRPVDSYAFEVA